MSSVIRVLKGIFRHTDMIDTMYMVIGSIGAICMGFSQPFAEIIYGQVLDTFNNDSDFSSAIINLCFWFIGLGCLNICCGVIQVTCWSIAGERQAQRRREEYVRSILRQEISWFDNQGAGRLITDVASHCEMIREGFGRKLGEVIMYSTQFFASYGIGFYLSWELTAVLMTAMPIMGLSGFLLVAATDEYVTKSSEQYAKAGAIASEVESMLCLTISSNQDCYYDVVNKFLLT